MKDEKRLLEMVAAGDPLPAVLGALCRAVQDLMVGWQCSVLLVDSRGTRFQCAAASTLLAGYFDSRPRWDAEAWRARALAHGLRAVWSTPILSRAQRTLGTFAIYQRETGEPNPCQQAVIQRFTHIASIAIERSQSEDALRRSEASLAEAQHLNRTGSFLWRASTDEITWSKEMYRIYEFDESEPLTLERANARVHPEDLAMYMEQVARARREPNEVEFDVRLQFPNGSIKHVHIVSHGSRDESGNVEYTGVVQDVTDRRRAEDALAKLQCELAHVARVSTLGTLTASIAHEVNQPLVGIITNASTCLRMLADDPPNLEGARETARRTIRDGRRASEIIARLRALFAKREAKSELVDLNEATREVIALSLTELRRNRVILRLELSDDLPLVMGDRIQLQQVLLNLLLNASQAMRGVDDRPRELLIVSERDEGDRVRLSVHDVGVGFEPQDADRLFEAFYTTKNGGIGIGLSVSRTIIENHGGQLRAERNDGPGATFSFSVPSGADKATGSHGPSAIPIDGDDGRVLGTS